VNGSGNPKKRQYAEAFPGIVRDARHRNDKNNTGKFQGCEVDPLEDEFGRAGAGLESLNEEMKENERPGARPHADSRGGSMPSQREEYPDEHAENQNCRKLV
jgi:hypothetical protein